MGRTLELSGDWLTLLAYVFQLAGLVLVLLFVVLPLKGIVSVLVALLFASVTIATAVALWRTATDSDERTHPGTVDDITYDPFADPGQAARDRWERAIRRLPDEDDKRD